MLFDPDEDPRSIAVFLVATAIFALRNPTPAPETALDHAESFVAAAEKRFGPLKD